MSTVVPRAGTWIETDVVDDRAVMIKSFPVRERGLKLLILVGFAQR